MGSPSLLELLHPQTVQNFMLKMSSILSLLKSSSAVKRAFLEILLLFLALL